MSLYDLPRQSVALLKAEDVSDAVRITLAALRGDKKCLIHHEACESWIREFYGGDEGEKVEFLSFTSESELDPEAIKSRDAKEIVFVDFDMYLELFGIRKTLLVLNKLKSHKRIYITVSHDIREANETERLASGVFSIKKTENTDVYDCSSVKFDKKGGISTSEQIVTLTQNGKPTFKTVRKTDDVVSTPTTTTVQNESGKGSFELPFFAGRQEDGVAIRDATKKKIRVGGQIVYEPDNEDDLDDSDPDDDLSI